MKKYKINKGFINQKLENKTIIFDSDKSVLYTLNETASFIFKKIKLGWDKEKIIEKMEKMYNIKKSETIKDFKELIKDLLRRKILIEE